MKHLHIVSSFLSATYVPLGECVFPGLRHTADSTSVRKDALITTTANLSVAESSLPTMLAVSKFAAAGKRNRQRHLAAAATPGTAAGAPTTAGGAAAAAQVAPAQQRLANNGPQQDPSRLSHTGQTSRSRVGTWLVGAVGWAATPWATLGLCSFHVSETLENQLRAK